MGDGASKLYLKNILSSMSSNFTDVKNAISGVSTKVDSVGTSVNAVSNNISILRPPIKTVSTWAYASGKSTLYQISGASGRLDYVVVGPLSHGKTLTLTIDGVTYKVKKTSTATTDMNCFFGSHNSPYFMLGEDYDNKYTNLLASFYGVRSRGQLPDTISFDRERVLLFSQSGMHDPTSTSGMDLKFSVTDSSAYSLCYLAKDIIFEQSLSISLSAGESLGAGRTDYIAVVSLFD